MGGSKGAQIDEKSIQIRLKFEAQDEAPLGKFMVSQSLIDLCTTCMELLEQILISGVQVPIVGPILRHVPRKDNTGADSLANRALDEGDLRHSDIAAWGTLLEKIAFCPNELWGICVQFDGAAHGNPSGPASFGVAIWAGVWPAEGFAPEVVLEAHAVQIGIASNNIAEFMGLRYSLQLILDRCLRLHAHMLSRALCPDVFA